MLLFVIVTKILIVIILIVIDIFNDCYLYLFALLIICNFFFNYLVNILPDLRMVSGQLEPSVVFLRSAGLFEKNRRESNSTTTLNMQCLSIHQINTYTGINCRNLNYRYTFLDILIQFWSNSLQIRRPVHFLRLHFLSLLDEEARRLGQACRKKSHQFIIS